MRVLSALVICLTLLVGAAVAAPGSFRGIVVESPGESTAGWIFVQGRNHMGRRVNVTRARVSYDEGIPPSMRLSDSPRVLAPGMEVRVTAEQDGAGEWQASEVEILRLPDSEGHGKKRVESTTARP